MLFRIHFSGGSELLRAAGICCSVSIFPGLRVPPGFSGQPELKRDKSVQKALAFLSFLCYTPFLSGRSAWGISTVGRTNHPYLRPTGNQFRKPTIGPMENLVGIVTKFWALAQMVARDIRIVEVRGSTPLCSTTGRSVELGCIGSRFALRINLKDS